MHAVDEFRAQMGEDGLEPPDYIEPDRFYRFPGTDKGKDNTAGFCKLFSDGLGGIYGDWSSGLQEIWQAERQNAFTPAEREEFQRQVQQARAQAEEERRAKQADAETRARVLWDAAEAAPADFPYLVTKGIKPHGVRVHAGRLVVPVRDGERLVSLQFISADGAKQFLSSGRTAGGYFAIGSLRGANALCIAEGLSTAATVHEATGFPVAVAFNAGNLEPVARAMRHRLPKLRLVLCADDDASTVGNPGLTKARAAAAAVDAVVAVPDFGEVRPEGHTDFNDMAAHRGLEAVAECIRDAAERETVADVADVAVAEWPEPQPLTFKVEPEPYPMDALPEGMRKAVEEVQRFVKAPVPLVASSALSALSLAVQGLVDVKRAEKLEGPVSVYVLTIADSGERKSTADNFFMSAIRRHQQEEAEALKPELARHKADMDAWAAQREGVLGAVRDAAKKAKPTDKLKADLADLERRKPTPPRVPRLLLEDETPENLAWSLAKEWPSAGVVSSEAGLVFGAHGMGRDSVLRNLALLNLLWDGGTHSVGRRTSESFTVRGARLTVGLQVQEAALRSFFERTGDLARGTGFLARFLTSWPTSTQGTRIFTESPEQWPNLARFHQRVSELLAQDVPMEADGSLSPFVLTMSPEAKQGWVAFHDEIEESLAEGCELCDVRDVASKAADNAARLAALFYTFRHGPTGQIALEDLAGACRIAAWHLNESRRFFGELAMPAEMANAARLDAWLIEYCRRERTHLVPTREAQRLGPGPTRQKDRLKEALAELEEAGRVRLASEGRRKLIKVNPALLEGTP
jgi:putative DNA primase/helicase